MADPGYGSNCYWTKPVLCAAFTALCFPYLFTTVCIYILITDEATIASADTRFSCALLQATLLLNCLSLSTLNLNTPLIH